MSTSPEPDRAEADVSRGTPFPPFNATVTSVPFAGTVLRPYVPFNLLLRNGPFEPKAMWKAAVGGIRALKQLSRGISENNDEPLQLISGHSQGHVLLWNADTMQLLTSCQHFNNVTVTQVVVTTSFVYCVVEKVAGGSSSDDTSVFMWNAKTLELIDTLSMHEERVLCLSVDEANEHRLATGGADHLIFLWNLKQSRTTPSAKLTGHRSTVTRVMLTEHVLISGGGDGEVRLWDVSTGTGTCLQIIDGHQGQVGLMEWSRKPNAGTNFIGALVTGCHGGFVRTWDYNIQTRGMAKAASHDAVSTPSASGEGGDAQHQQQVSSPMQKRTTFTLGNGNVVSLVGAFLNKAHKAIVADVAVDDLNGIVVSCSPTDGVDLFHAERKHNVKLNNFSTGVHNIAVDGDRRILLVGTDLGELAFFDYKSFAGTSSAGFGDELITLVAAFQPHLSGITSMVLERGRYGRWSRIITSSADSTILTIDFQTERDATLLGTMSTNCLLKTPNGSLLLPLEKDAAPLSSARSDVSGSSSAPPQHNAIGSAELYSCRHLKAIDAPKKTAALQGRRATAMALATTTRINPATHQQENVTKIVIGTDDGNVRFFGYQMYVPDEPASPGGSNGPEEFLETGLVVPLGGYVVRRIAEAGPYVVLCLQRIASTHAGASSSRTGAMAIVDIRTEALVTDAIPLLVYPVEASAFLVPRQGGASSSSSHAHDAHPQDLIIAAQLRTGEVAQLAWRSGARTLAFQRTLIPEQYTAQQVEDGMAPFPSRFLSSLNTKFDPPRLNLIAVDGAVTLRGLEASTAADNATPNLFVAQYDQREIIDLCAFPQGEMAYVVALDSPALFVVGVKGERLFEIGYDGAVLDCTQPEYTMRHTLLHPKRHRTFVSAERSSVFSQRAHPNCSAVAVSLEGRMIAIGYRDGLIQLWDSGTRRVFKRIVAHRSPVASIWCFGEEKRILSCATSGFLRADVLWSRSLKDKKNQTRAQQSSFGK